MSDGRRVLRAIWPMHVTCHVCDGTDHEPAGTSRVGHRQYRRCRGCGATISVGPIAFEVLIAGARRSRVESVAT